MVMAFRDKWKIERMAAGHCTGQFAFAELIRVFGPRFDSDITHRCRRAN
jgi:7,8-dihydropterin-6-yl-methyl-4-(beta-D-ribofuranosyl)aminobenzene 5'-phosphate synthase